MIDDTISVPDFVIEGRTFAVRLERDNNMLTPWEEHDGHGIVSSWEMRTERPGERVLAKDRHGSMRFYDVQESLKIAQRDGWDAPPYRTGTMRQQAMRAVNADFERLRHWCEGDWCWVVLVVSPLCQCCGEKLTGEEQYLGGIESDSGEDYVASEARAMAREWLYQQRSEET